MSRFDEILASMPHTPSKSVLNETIQETLASQHAVISRAQLKALGLTTDSIRRRVGTFELFETNIARGIYTGQAAPLTLEGRRQAGLLWAPAGTWLTGASATATLGLERAQDAVVQLVTLDSNEHRKRSPGVILHRASELHPDDLSIVHGVPCTKAARATFDVAQFATPHRLDRLIRQAEDLRIYDHTSMHRLYAARSNYRGADKFAAALNRLDEASDRARSEFEVKTAALLRTSRELPEVVVNAVLLDVESDLWS
jgi:hypothetical protein